MPLLKSHEKTSPSPAGEVVLTDDLVALNDHVLSHDLAALNDPAEAVERCVGLLPVIRPYTLRLRALLCRDRSYQRIFVEQVGADSLTSYTLSSAFPRRLLSNESSHDCDLTLI